MGGSNNLTHSCMISVGKQFHGWFIQPHEKSKWMKGKIIQPGFASGFSPTNLMVKTMVSCFDFRSKTGWDKGDPPSVKGKIFQVLPTPGPVTSSILNMAGGLSFRVKSFILHGKADILVAKSVKAFPHLHDIMVFYHVLPWFYHGFTMVLPWFTMFFPWFSHGFHGVFSPST